MHNLKSPIKQHLILWQVLQAALLKKAIPSLEDRDQVGGGGHADAISL